MKGSDADTPDPTSAADAEAAAAAADVNSSGAVTPNDRRHYRVTARDLPLHCPMPGMSLWNSHPRVFLPIEQTGTAKCPYCGAEFTLESRS